MCGSQGLYQNANGHNQIESALLRLQGNWSTVKTKPRFGGCHTCFGCETKTGVVRILLIFQGRPMFSHIIQKVSARAFD